MAPVFVGAAEALASRVAIKASMPAAPPFSAMKISKLGEAGAAASARRQSAMSPAFRYPTIRTTTLAMGKIRRKAPASPSNDQALVAPFLHSYQTQVAAFRASGLYRLAAAF